MHLSLVLLAYAHASSSFDLQPFRHSTTWALVHPGLSWSATPSQTGIRTGSETCERGVQHTDNELVPVQSLFCGMISGNNKHVFHSIGDTLLAEAHLHNGRVYGFSRDLAAQEVEFTMRDRQGCGGVFVLQTLGSFSHSEVHR